MSDFEINKGVGREVEFKGLRAQYLFIFAFGLPAVYMMTNTTNTASRPPQKMKRYWLSSPLNSTFLPIPLLISKSIVRCFTGRTNAGW